jgi:hypothetical protein
VAALGQSTDYQVNSCPELLLSPAAPGSVEWATVRPAITFKVYGARVERTETAVHMAFGQFKRDPDAKPCMCGVCMGLALAAAKWQRL